MIAGITYIDSTVTSGQTYFYVVTSLNSNNVESANSAEVTVTVP
jgi:fibronectin type 3 domain-containing protein